MSFKQGRKYDDPASAQEIPGFINFHQLDMSEVLKPTDQFKSFNEFFYRELKPDARPCSAPNNPKTLPQWNEGGRGNKTTATGLCKT